MNELMQKVLFNLDLSKHPLHMRYMLIDQTSDEDLTRCAQCNGMTVEELWKVLDEYRKSIASRAFEEFSQKMKAMDSMEEKLEQSEEHIVSLNEVDQNRLNEMATQKAEHMATVNQLKSEISKMKSEKGKRTKSIEAIKSRFALAMQAMDQGDKISLSFAEATLRAMADEVACTKGDH